MFPSISFSCTPESFRSDSVGPGQHLATAIHEVGESIASRNNTVTTRWTPAHQGAEGNEAADAWTGVRQRDATPETTTKHTCERRTCHT